MAGRFQFIRMHHLCHLGNLSLLHTAEGGGQFEHDVVSFGRIFRIVSFSTLAISLTFI